MQKKEKITTSNHKIEITTDIAGVLKPESINKQSQGVSCTLESLP